MLSFSIEISAFFIEIMTFFIEILSFSIEIMSFFIKILGFSIVFATFFSVLLCSCRLCRNVYGLFVINFSVQAYFHLNCDWADSISVGSLIDSR